ncbi:MAG: PolC-type DNA polymerase III [Firmicutes bacterium]|nr:PolC-type DNA polymerase III [Bacillota bacterium]
MRRIVRIRPAVRGLAPGLAGEAVDAREALAGLELVHVWVDTGRRTVRVVVAVPEGAPAPDPETLAGLLAEGLPGRVEVELRSPFEAAWERAVAELMRESAAAGMLAAARARLEDGTVRVELSTEAEREIARRHRLGPRLEAALAAAGVPARVRWSVAPQGRAAPPAEAEEEVVRRAAEALATRRRRAPEEGERLWGESVPERTVPIAECTEEGARVTVRGRVCHVETRELRGGRHMCRLDIWDGTDTISARLFGEAEEIRRVAERLAAPSEVRARGTLAYDARRQELQLNVEALLRFEVEERLDTAPEKRVELHVHTRMSAMDGLADVERLVERAARWGHRAVGVTDHGVVQAFPEAHEAGRRHGVKILYGMEAYVVDDRPPLVLRPDHRPAAGRFVSLDLETTGLSPRAHDIIEIGAVRWEAGEPVERFQTFVDCGRPIPPEVQELTGIRPEMLAGAPPAAEALRAFLDFAGDDPLVAHNAAFDAGFLYRQVQRHLGGEYRPPVIDTMWLARALLPELSGHGLGPVAAALRVPLPQHHRALADAETAGGVYVRLLEKARETAEVVSLEDLETLADRVPSRLGRPFHATVFAASEEGLRTLYRLVTRSHLEFFHRVPRLPRSLLAEARAGLLIGAGCAESEVVDAWLSGEPDDEWLRRLAFYDFLEVVPRDALRHLCPSALAGEEDLRALQRAVVEAGRTLGKPVCAVGDVHFLDPEEAEFRAVLHANQHAGDEHAGALHLRTTEEMLEEFRFLGEETAREIVIEEPVRLAEALPDLSPLPDGLHAPHLDRAAEEVAEEARRRAAELYGEPLPPPVAERLEYELDRIIRHGYAALYLIAARLVRRSLEDGYLVGSRGSVGSSFVATLLGITEVNPLPPHYRCPACRYTEFASGDGEGTARSGFDLPRRACPRCGAELVGDGHDIPFASFMGFEGDKVPDIDLNFSGEYQPRAHRAAEELLGEGNVFRAGTISTVAERTAYGFARAYAEARGRTLRGAELERLARGCTGVKRTTGQHPGGLMVVPRGADVHAFTPLQYPANDPEAGQVTTHFDYHSISGRLVKLDLLGHDDPTALRMLQNWTGVDPRSIPFDDEATRSLFSSCAALGVDPEDIGTEVGCLGIPEFGTRFVRGMLVDTRPRTFADLVRISGLSHGTDVWANNARDLTRAGIATLSQVISTRDDLFLYLIECGMDRKQAFDIGERVRKGKGLREEDVERMRAAGVPDWYIESCQKISYLFPKAHAVAYVMMAFRIAWFKVHRPAAFYAVYFTLNAADFDAAWLEETPDAWRRRLEAVDRPGAPAKERNQWPAGGGRSG